MNSKENRRRVWFITRPERDPHFHEDALKALRDSTDNFSVKWDANRVAHKAYEAQLNKQLIKRASISKDGSGGRTWMAMLKTFAYCYTDDTGEIIPTKSALEILKGNLVFENVCKQILTLQIPNAYFLESGFRPKFEETFEIFPVRFLIKLCCSESLDYHITKEEITYIAMTCQNNGELSNTIARIKAYRLMSSESKAEFHASVANEYDHRTRSDKGARDYYLAHSDVAHTFMLIAEFTQLVVYERGKNSRLALPQDKRMTTPEFIQQYDSRYPFNKKYLYSLERMAEVNGLDVNSYKASRYGSIKPATNLSKKINKALNILNDLHSILNPTVDEFLEILKNNSFNETEAIQISEIVAEQAGLYHSRTLNENAVTSLINETDNLVFEKRVGELLKEFGFEVIMHPRTDTEQTEIDILIKYGDKCGIIDAKNYKERFTLSSSLSSHMASEYIPNYISYDNLDLEFYGYIVCSKIAGDKNLEKITERALMSTGKTVKGFMINVQTLLALLDYCIENNIELNERQNLIITLSSNESYSSFSSLKSIINQKEMDTV